MTEYDKKVQYAQAAMHENPTAEEIIEFQAAAIRDALRACGVREEDIHNHLLENGYIPGKEEE